MPKYTSVQKDYARYRLNKSKEDLEAAKLLLDNGNYRIANNRAYYSIFHALRAMLVLDNFDSSKHSGVIAEFRRRYIKENIFPIEMSKMIGSAFTIRNASDYDDMFIASKDETIEQIDNAECVYGLIEGYIREAIDDSEKG
ncbi:MAG: HEPN domain-containing protein [Lachnospiraceae bacterium]|nr:HEPN domain-containing protein [Lachnospiraceae bacterium]MBD5502441.1 HEPN domain-containing protein [Lachnospiraceae bacterium]